jgi:hypothetical protein
MENLGNEIWKAHPDPKYSKYLFSNMGRAKSFHGYNQPERILKPCNDALGYPRIGPSVNGKSQSLHLHKLIAETFLDCKGGLGREWTVDHIDEDPSNCKLENLRIIKRGQNTQRAHVKTVRLTNLKTEKHYDFESLSACAKYLGKSHGYVGKVVSGKYTQPNGWKIERIEIDVDEILGIK